MRTLKVLTCAVLACALAAGSLQAQTATGQMKWVSPGSAWASFTTNGGTNSQNIYTSPYRAQFSVNGSPNMALLPPAGTGGAFGSTWDIYCVDFDHYANTGTSNVFLTNFADAQANNWFGTYTRTHTLQQYVEAAYLAQKIQAGGDKALYSGAMWQIMTGGTFAYKGGTSGVSSWTQVQGAVDDAVAAYLAGTTLVNLADWVVVTEYAADANGRPTFDVTGKPVLGTHQEFITQVTPEPATLLLLGTGLVLLLVAAGAARRPIA